MPTARRRLTGAGIAGAFLLLVLLSSFPLVPDRAGGAEVSEPTVTVTPTRVVDGQSVTINVRTPADRSVIRAEARLCRAGVDYPAAPGLRPPAVVATGGPNCPLTPVSSSADVSVINTNTSQTAGTDAGESFLYRVGAGVVAWTDLDGVDRTLTCDEEHACALVVYLRVAETDAPIWRPFVTTLDYAADDPFAGCGGPAQGVLNTSGSDRLTETWVGWTVAECTREGRTGAAGRATFPGEGLALSQFRKGTVDLAYTGGGFNDEIGLVQEEEPDPDAPEPPPVVDRPAVAVPIGVNAAVVAVAGGVRTATTKIPFRDLRLTAEELAVLFGQGGNRIEPHREAILERNPELAEGGLFDLTAGFQVGAPADAEISSWYLTHYLDELAPDAAWTVPDLEIFADDRGRPRASHAHIARADPSFANALTTLTGRSSVVRGLATISPGTSGAVWLMTDLSTARTLGLTVVQIENADGDFVAPTDASMRAALEQMDEDDAGILVGDPAMVAKGGGVTPYPLTFVEYAVAPRQPLTSVTCTARPTSQALLTGWLEYITGDGQEELADGLLPLTADLADAAEARIPLVGAAEVTGPCADTATTTTTVPPTGPTTPTTASAAAGGEPDSSGELTATASTGGSRPTSRGAAPPANTAVTIVDEDDGDDGGGGIVDAIIPAFAGRNAVGWIGVAVAVVLITAFHSAASAATARTQSERRELPPT